MKKQILRLAFVAAMVGTIATGCSSVNETGSSDSTDVDTTKVIHTDTTVTTTDTVKKDTVKP